MGCLAGYGGSAFPYHVLGGFSKVESQNETDEALYLTATALVITFFVNSNKETNELGPALDWEEE